MKMTERVKQILSWYSSENPGTLTNIARLLMHGRLAGTGKLVILPVDQGFEHGPARSFAPNPPAYDPDYHHPGGYDGGRLDVAADREKATRYTAPEAMSLWQAGPLCSCHGLRPDGKPNRPLTAFTVELEPVETEAAHDEAEARTVANS